MRRQRPRTSPTTSSTISCRQRPFQPPRSTDLFFIQHQGVPQMDAADAPAESTIEERRQKGTREEQLAALGADTAEAAEPEKPEPEKPEQDMEAGAASSASNNATTLENRPQPSISPANTTQPSRETTPDSAAAPVSPPPPDRMRRPRFEPTLLHPNSPQPSPKQSPN